MQGWGNLVNTLVLVILMAAFGQTSSTYNTTSLKWVWRLSYGIGLIPLVFMVSAGPRQLAGLAGAQLGCAGACRAAWPLGRGSGGGCLALGSLPGPISRPGLCVPSMRARAGEAQGPIPRQLKAPCPPADAALPAADHLAYLVPQGERGVEGQEAVAEGAR